MVVAVTVFQVRDSFAGSFGIRIIRAACETAAMAGARVLTRHLGFGVEVPLAGGVYALMAWGLRVIAADGLVRLIDMARLLRRRSRPAVQAASQ